MDNSVHRVEVGDFYEITPDGDVYSKSRQTTCPLNRVRNKKSKKLKPRFDKDGYVLISIYCGGKQKNFRVHRLVAMAFIPNPDNKPFINHKDGNKANNHVNNLEWSTQSENEKHAICFLNKVQPKGAASKLSTKIVATFPDGHKELIYGQNEAARVLGLSQANIYRCLTGEYKSTKGYKFCKVD